MNAAKAQVHVYEVQSGDTLSQIAQKLLGSPVYPKDGSLQKLLKLNPSITNPDFLREGTTLKVVLVENSHVKDVVAVSKEKSKTTVIERTIDEGVALREVSSSSEKKNFSPSFITLGGSVGQIQIDATDKSNNTDARLSSSSVLGFAVSLGQRYSEKLVGEYGLSYESFRFEAPQSVIGFKDLDAKRLNFFAQLEYKMNNIWKITGTLPFVQNLFITASPTSSQYQIDKVTSLAPAVAGDYSWYKSADLDSSIGLVAQTFLPASGDMVKTYLGYGAGPRIRTRQKLGSLEGETTLGYFYQTQKTNLTEQNISQYYLNFKLFMDLCGK